MRAHGKVAPTRLSNSGPPAMFLSTREEATSWGKGQRLVPRVRMLQSALSVGGSLDCLDLIL